MPAAPLSSPQKTLPTPHANVELITITQQSHIPLLGSIAFGILDRGSSLIQARPTTICNMECTFCSTSANNFSLHPVHYIVEPTYLLSWVRKAAHIKKNLHVNIDSVGEPTTYSFLEEFIEHLHDIPEVSFISMQTNGTLLNQQKIKALENAGLNRIHLSIHSLSALKSKTLMGRPAYDLSHILHVIQLLQQSTIELLLAPVWIPRVNDQDIEDILAFAQHHGLHTAIQKYEEYKYSRKQPHARSISYPAFYKQLKHWQRSFNTKLIYSARDLQVHKAPSFPLVFHKNERINAIIRSRGWLQGQMLAEARNRCITVVHCTSTIGDRINLRITETKHNIYLAEPL